MIVKIKKALHLARQARSVGFLANYLTSENMHTEQAAAIVGILEIRLYIGLPEKNSSRTLPPNES